MPVKNQNIKYLAVILGGALAFIILFGWGIYKYHWQGGWAYRLSKIIPYPALLVNWEVISYRTYLDDLRTLTRYWSKERDNPNVFLGIPAAGEIRERLLEKLVEEKIVQIWARQNNVRLSEEEIAAEWEKFSRSQNTKTATEKFLAEIYGWPKDKFTDRVLRPFLLQVKVKAALIAQNLVDDARLKARADKIYGLTQEPDASFAAIARAESDDRESARQGGNLGYFSRGTLAPEVAQVIFAMKIGDISKPVKSSYGYHIIQLDDILYDEKGLATQAAIKQILIKAFDFDDWLSQQKAGLAIYRLVL